MTESKTQILKCNYCGKDVKVFPCELNYKHHFCCKECGIAYKRGSYS